MVIGKNLVEILKSSVRNEPLIWFIFELLLLIFPFLYVPGTVSKEHGIPYRTALMNLRIWMFGDRALARRLRLAHENREDHK